MEKTLKIETPPLPAAEAFTDPEAALARLREIYDGASRFLCEKFTETLKGGVPETRFRAFYPEIRFSTATFAQADSRLSFGHVAEPGTYATTVTRPGLFGNYLKQQMRLLIENHGVPVVIGASETPMPVHFAVANDSSVTVPQDGAMDFHLRDVFDVPDLSTTHDDIVNGNGFTYPDGARPLAPFTAQRIDYSLARLAHYTATDPQHFQNHVLFTNYQFYVEEFEAYARHVLADPESGYTSFVGPNNQVITDPEGAMHIPAKMPQMPTYHLKRANGQGITLVNIGVGPSNAKTATDHIAVLRPHAWLMVGHCAGLRNSQRLGDFVLAHGSRSRRWPRSRSRSRRRWSRSRRSRAMISSGSCAPAPWRPSTTATGSCATSPARCSVCRSRGPWRSTWKAPPSRPTASASGCPTARCSAFPTSRCMAS